MISPQVRPYRQHHLGVGEVADPGTRMSNGARAGLTGFVAAWRDRSPSTTSSSTNPARAFLTDRLRSGFQDAARASNARWTTGTGAREEFADRPRR